MVLSIANDLRSSSPLVAFICGPKNCGKTTFSRHLLNVLLYRRKKVAYLNTDVGQPEFTPPGFLSLTIIDSLTTGVGYKVLVDILKHIDPSHVVRTNIYAESENLPDGAFWLDEGNDDDTTLININSARQDCFNRS